MPATRLRSFDMPQIDGTSDASIEADAATEILRLLSSVESESFASTNDEEGTAMWF